MRWSKQSRAALLLAVLLSSWAAPAFAQGCAMCYTTAAAASADGQKAINKAVVILLVPTLSVMTLGVITAFRYARARDKELNQPSAGGLPWPRMSATSWKY